MFIGTICYSELSLLKISWFFCLHMTSVLKDSRKWQLLEHFRRAHHYHTRKPFFLAHPPILRRLRRTVLGDVCDLTVWCDFAGKAGLLRGSLMSALCFLESKKLLQLESKHFFLLKCEIFVCSSEFSEMYRSSRNFSLKLVLENQPHNSLL